VRSIQRRTLINIDSTGPRIVRPTVGVVRPPRIAVPIPLKPIRRVQGAVMRIASNVAGIRPTVRAPWPARTLSGARIIAASGTRIVPRRATQKRHTTDAINRRRMLRRRRSGNSQPRREKEAREGEPAAYEQTPVNAEPWTRPPTQRIPVVRSNRQPERLPKPKHLKAPSKAPSVATCAFDSSTGPTRSVGRTGETGVHALWRRCSRAHTTG
jgi:hypothetical protein